MMRRASALMVDLYEVIAKFVELSGWESLENGCWTGKWTSEVAFDIEYFEGDFYQREQNYIFVADGPPNDIRNYFDHAPKDGIITLDFIKKCGESREYTDKNGVSHPYIRISFGHMVHYLREVSELPWESRLIITNRSF